MTIQEEIVRIQTAKSDIQQAITAKGVEVDDSDSISTYSDKINAINIVGEKGDPGDSAYEIAVKNGFTGTEAEWLASLKGETGEDGAAGENGINGLSAYEVAVINGFVGTETEWLESLRNTDCANIKKRVITLVDTDLNISSTDNLLTFNIALQKNAMYIMAFKMNGCVYQKYFSPISISDTTYTRYFFEFYFNDNNYNTCRVDIYKDKIALNPIWAYEGFTMAQITHLWIMRIENEVYADEEAALSAYEIAVKNGFSGTEDEWLASLKGERGEDGIQGTDGEKGDTGDSAYQIAVNNGFAGTEAEWLSSLNGLPIGFEYFSPNPNIPNGSLPLFGSEYSREVFPDLWEYAESQTGYVITEEEWQALSNQNDGNVPFYSSGDGTTTFRVPSLKCWIKGASGIEEVGSYLTAGLPNIEGSFEPRPHPTGNINYGGAICITDGAFTLKHQGSSVQYNGMTESSGRYNLDTVKFSAQRYNQIYGNSDTVQPPSIVGMWLVKAYGTVLNEGNAEASAAVEQYARLEERINSIDFDGIYIVEAQRNATEWYRIWSDGWIEQGGEAFQDNAATYVVHLLKPYINTDYFACVTLGINECHTGSPATKYISVYDMTTTSFTTYTTNTVGLRRKRWYACGQGEVPAKLLQQGIKGESAYEIAIRNGFEGTEDEWLASLKGETGDQGPKGNTGDQGIQGEKGDVGEQGIQGDPGPSGASAYDIAVKNGFVGTETEWLASLKGEKGDPGTSSSSGGGSGAAYITETYNDDSKWYRIWSDGWVEQGGILVTTSASSQLITFPVEMASDLFNVDFHIVKGGSSNNTTNNVRIDARKTTSTSVTLYIQPSDETYTSWIVRGMKKV